MAVVLKTGRIGYDIAVIFCRAVRCPDLEYLAIIPAPRLPSEIKPITDRAFGSVFPANFERFSRESHTSTTLGRDRKVGVPAIIE